MSIRFFKRLRRAEGLFATERCRPPVAELDPIQQRQADALVARALYLQAHLARREDEGCSRVSIPS